MQTLMFAWRSLRRAPAFALAAALTLSIGIGSTTAIFTVLDTVLLKPLPYRDAERLAGVWVALPGMGFPLAPQSFASYFTIRRFAKSIEGIAIFDRSSVNVEGSGGDAKPERVRASLVSASTFPLLGVSLMRGRTFSPDEDTPRGNGVVIIGDGLWRRMFGADASVLGKKIQIDGRQREIIGVAPANFHFPDVATQLWLPIAADSTLSVVGFFAHQGFVRLKPGVTIAVAQREMNALVPRISERYPNIAPGMPAAPFLARAHASVAIHPMRDDIVGTFGNVVWIAGSAGALLLLISFANVASLLLTRAEARQRELAVRVALGAGPRRVIAQFLGESVVLSVIGGVLGLGLAVAGVRMFVHSGPPGIPRLDEVHVDATVVLFTSAIVVLLAAACSILPALRYDTKRLASRLRDGARGGTSGRDRQRARRTLVVTQVALATVLVGGAGVLFRAFQHLHDVRPGFDTKHTLTLWLSLPSARYANDTAVVRFTSRLIERAAVVPGVQAAGVSSKVPLNGTGGNYTPVWSDADRDEGTALPPSEEVITATGGYFNAMGIPLLAGRTFDPPDRQNASETIIDRSLAKQYWGDSTGRAALGHRLRFAPNWWLTVVGVVGSVHDTSLAAAPSASIYVPQVVPADSTRSLVARTIALTVRTSGDPRALVTSLQSAVADVDRSLPPFNVAPMSEIADRSMARLSFVMTIIAVTASVSLILAAVGLYGVLAYMVSLRAREISVRLAMGALPFGVARLVSGQGAALAGVGVALGMTMLFLASWMLRTLIVGVERPDAATVVLVAGFLMFVAICASWIPARRAARIDPARALSGE
ncbi:MAG: ABC transporter permease [bacterium]